MTEAGMIEAVVQVGVLETRYLRCGRGDRGVVVLAGSDEERLTLVRLCNDGRCVVAPIPSEHQVRAGTPPTAAADRDSEAAALEIWLRGVIDGLGLERPAVVLGREFTWLAGWLGERCADTLELDAHLKRDRT
ncbi:MAG TPA: hypothetical protein VHG09_09415 [Longimicrobiales bacterium]|nr:hypothetical protein [Longimicrobiales bacterium]